MSGSLARTALAIAFCGALLAALPAAGAPAKPASRLGVPVVVTFLNGSYASLDAGAGFRRVPLTGFALGYVPSRRVDRSRDVPIVLVGAQLFPQATDLLVDASCGELAVASRLNPETSLELTAGGGRATLRPSRTVTITAPVAIRLKLDLRPAGGCGQPLVPAATHTTVAAFTLRGRAGASTGLSRVSVTSKLKSVDLDACLTPSASAAATRCAGPIEKLPTKVALHLLLRVDLGVGDGRWAYPDGRR